MSHLVGDASEEHARPEALVAIKRRHPWRMLAAIIIVVLAALFIYDSAFNRPVYNWPEVGKYLFDQRIITAIGYTLQLTVYSMVIAIVLGVLLAVMRQSPNPVVKSVSWVYLWIFRGTPVYVQLTFWGLVTVVYKTITIGIPFTEAVGALAVEFVDHVPELRAYEVTCRHLTQGDPHADDLPRQILCIGKIPLGTLPVLLVRDPVAIILPVLGEEDKRRRIGRLERQHECQSGEAERRAVEPQVGRGDRVPAEPSDDEDGQVDEETRSPGEARDRFRYLADTIRISPRADPAQSTRAGFKGFAEMVSHVYRAPLSCRSHRHRP